MATLHLRVEDREANRLVCVTHLTPHRQEEGESERRRRTGRAQAKETARKWAGPGGSREGKKKRLKDCEELAKPGEKKEGEQKKDQKETRARKQKTKKTKKTSSRR